MIRELMVDTLLPLQGMVTLYFIYSECLESLGNTVGGISPLYAIPFLCTATQIKNSGIYFVALACILFIISMRRDRTGVKRDKTVARRKIFAMAAPFVSLYLWHAHCSYVFSSSSLTAHAMTFQNYKYVLSQKTEGAISAILINVFKFAVSGKELYMLILFITIIGVLSFFLGSRMKKKYLQLVSVSVVIYITYMAGTAGMYLVSMWGEDANNLASSGRYRKTIFIAIYYLFLLLSMEIISSIESIKRGWIYMLGVYTALFVIWATEGETAFPIVSPYNIFPYNTDGKRAMIEQVIEENEVPNGASCLICAPTEPAGQYIRHVCRYVLWSDDVSRIHITERNQLDDNAGNYEYILIFDNENTCIREWIREKYPEQEGKVVIVQK